MVSIIIAAYNTADYLQECLASIAAQTYDKLQVIVVDDGSEDATLALASQFAEKDERFSVISKPHSNAGDARNLGLAQAQGDYLLFFDADDRMVPTMLEELVARAEECDADVVCCRSRSFLDGEQGYLDVNDGPHVEDFSQVYAGTDFGVLLSSHFVGWPWDKLFRSSFVRAHDLRFQSLSSTNDAFFVYCSLALAERIALVDAPLAEHRKHGGSIEGMRWKTPHNVRCAYEAIVERLQDEPVWSELSASFHLWGVRHMRWNFLTLAPHAQGKAFDDYLWCLDGVVERGIELDEEDRRIYDAIERGRASQMDVEVAQQALKTIETDAIRDSLEHRLAETEAELAELRYAFEHVVESASFKAGRALTLPGRLLRDQIKRQ